MTQQQLEQLTGFDYTLIADPLQREYIEKQTRTIRARGKRMAKDILAIGEAARGVKERLDHGQFVAWANAEFAEEFGWSYQTLHRFMQVADHFQNSQIERFGKSALYLLSQNSTPEEARDEARERADAGEQITHQAAKEIVQRHRQPEPDLNAWKEGWEMIDPGDGTVSAWHPQYGEAHAPDLNALLVAQRQAWLNWEFNQSKQNRRQHPADPAPPLPSEPDPLPADLLIELSRLGWELRSSRVSPMGLHLHTFADDGGRGQTEERSRDGWEQMRDDLQADEQRRLMMRIRVIVQRLHQEDRSQEAYELIRGITDNRQREALQADVDEGLARAQRFNEYSRRFTHGALVVWQRRDGDVVGRSRGMSFGGERLRLMVPPDSADMRHEHTVDPAKCREYDEQADAHLLEPEPEPAQPDREAVLQATHGFIRDMTVPQWDLLCHVLDCTRSEVAERLIERFGTEHVGFLRVLKGYL